MLIQYRDSDKRIITEQHALGSHYKDYIDENGLLKIRESKLNSKVESVLYYKGQNETASEIEALYGQISTIESLYIREREIYKDYVIEEERTYWRNVEIERVELQQSIIKWIYDSKGDNISYELIDSSLPIDHPNHRVINKTYYLNGSDYKDDEKSYITTGYRGYDNTFDYMAYVKIGQSFDEQDIEYMDLQASINFMTALGISQQMQNWYLSNVLLPPE